jgi:hypothetical protein
MKCPLYSATTRRPSCVSAASFSCSGSHPASGAGIDVTAVIESKIAVIGAYRSQFAFEPELIPTLLLHDLFGVEYFVRARPPKWKRK